MYMLFYDGEKPPVASKLPKAADGGWGSKGKDARTLGRSADSADYLTGPAKRTRSYC